MPPKEIFRDGKERRRAERDAERVRDRIALGLLDNSGMPSLLHCKLHCCFLSGLGLGSLYHGTQASDSRSRSSSSSSSSSSSGLYFLGSLGFCSFLTFSAAQTFHPMLPPFPSLNQAVPSLPMPFSNQGLQSILKWFWITSSL